MPPADAPRPRPGRPPTTSRAQILAAARGLIDRDGWERLTIRKLAAELGVGATTLYHHVHDKEDLLLLLINEYGEQVSRPRLPDEPRERVVVAAATIHDALAAWPWAAEVLTTDGFIARLGASPLGLVEAVVAGAVDHGCTPEHAVYVFRTIWYYTVGEILVRSHTARRGQGDAVTRQGAFFGSIDAGKLPHLAALGDRWAVLAPRDTYVDGLRALVDGLLAQGARAQP
ncbi:MULTISPECIES: TetR/AcrR family transcriptional regulator [unclassified Micromonospora]|uniref:TetR/AcrR family transcriptional regulator n=1 Tax=unclassified Micromonospora TaxID=2617518 RepID=UPI0022B64995|nr:MULTISPECIES: TetR/AcrR family transcriptional regulator [unclassified Micromonospora]MCZ7422761.1 TetR/AcrR family transcriptional regulator [Verrucosispora sp. WMMA2121]WBB90501.1 TetR/AcrR family transcriptional regulator [Verrucosispora sp. WMMC514]